MKHKFKTFILIFGLVFGFMMNVHAEVTIKEDANTYEGDVYIIGSSRFDSNTIITGTMATVAGAREAYIQYAINQNDKFKPEDVKIYYYSELAETWSVLPATSKDEIKELTEEEKKIAFEHIDSCRCGGGPKKMFGEDIEWCCGTNFRFNVPTMKDLPFMKKMVLLKMMEIDDNN